MYLPILKTFELGRPRVVQFKCNRTHDLVIFRSSSSLYNAAQTAHAEAMISLLMPSLLQPKIR